MLVGRLKNISLFNNQNNMYKTQLEKRKVRRFNLNLATNVVGMNGEELAINFSCVTKNISSLGALLVTEFELDIGTQIELQFKIPAIRGFEQDRSYTTIRGTGVVSRAHFNSLAITFDKACKIGE